MTTRRVTLDLIPGRYLLTVLDSGYVLRLVKGDTVWPDLGVRGLVAAFQRMEFDAADAQVETGS